MSFWKSTPGVLLILVGVTIALLIGAVWVRVHRLTHPPRQAAQALDFAAMDLPVEEVRFPSADGVLLEGWLVRGRVTEPVILLCHDRAHERSSLVSLMIRLHESGFSTFAFDFRGHGDSEGDASTLGVLEKRDVLGAVTYLSKRAGFADRPLGVYGVGMGAHAAVLAAADRVAIRVLVLDGVYPDVAYPLSRGVFGGWSAGSRNLSWLPRVLFLVTTGVSPLEERAADRLPRLVGREVLLVSPAADSPLATEMQRMYEQIPQRKDSEGNLITLPAIHASQLYGAELERHHSRVARFFELRLRAPAAPEEAGRPG